MKIGPSFFLIVGALLSPSLAHAQSTSDSSSSAAIQQQTQQSGTSGTATAQADSGSQSKPPVNAVSPAPQAGDEQGKGPVIGQTKHIAGIVPNYRAVDADLILPPLSPRGKFKLAIYDSFDYGSFVFAGLQAAYYQGTRAYPEFGNGMRGYGRYYWHAFSDQTVSNMLTDALVPIATREDPRFYTSGHGSILRRTIHAFDRLVITKTDAGGTTFNISEIVGTGIGSGITSLYYPGQERTFVKVAENWETQLLSDGIANIAKEFWPDIRRKLHHGN
ncbi:MAG TPA: hypothetical protein VKR82_08345 [Candidatus Acidoferrales bacterium]|nr:hypothetical protein [Candidatus Acidoferrales bacterium]